MSTDQQITHLMKVKSIDRPQAQQMLYDIQQHCAVVADWYLKKQDYQKPVTKMNFNSNP